MFRFIVVGLAELLLSLLCFIVSKSIWDLHIEDNLLKQHIIVQDQDGENNNNNITDMSSYRTIPIREEVSVLRVENLRADHTLPSYWLDINSCIPNS